MQHPLSRRTLFKTVAAAISALALPGRLTAGLRQDADQARLAEWIRTLRTGGLTRPEILAGRIAAGVGELAVGTPYVPGTLDAYLRGARRAPPVEPLTLSLTRFDCVTLVESCLAVARAAGGKAPASWDWFAWQIQRMRYRGGIRRGYASRLHYFSEWITDGGSRGLLRDLGVELGGIEDARPLRFMTEHRASYPAFADPAVFRSIQAVERRLDARPRRVVPTARIPEVADRIETGDVLAFATAIPGLDVTHAAYAYRDAQGTLRVLHAPLSGGAVEVTRVTLPEYVAAIRQATGILVARPLRG